MEEVKLQGVPSPEFFDRKVVGVTSVCGPAFMSRLSEGGTAFAANVALLRILSVGGD